MKRLVQPISYDLEFEPDFRKFTFSAKAKIIARCNSSTPKIVMDCAELKIRSCKVYEGKKPVKCTVKTNAKSEDLIISLGSRVSGSVSIDLEFTGILNDRLLGFYRSTYVQGGKKRYMATTQFEAADARRAFPCWDEPEAKASFQISLIAKNPHTAVSNMPIKSYYQIFGAFVITCIFRVAYLV